MLACNGMNILEYHGMNSLCHGVANVGIKVLGYSIHFIPTWGTLIYHTILWVDHNNQMDKKGHVGRIPVNHEVAVTWVLTDHMLTIDARPNATLASFGKPWRGWRTCRMIWRFSHLSVRFGNRKWHAEISIFPRSLTPETKAKKKRRQLGVLTGQMDRKYLHRTLNATQINLPFLWRFFVHNSQ